MRRVNLSEGPRGANSESSQDRRRLESQLCGHLPGVIMTSKVEWCFMQRNVPASFLALTLFLVVPMYAQDVAATADQKTAPAPAPASANDASSATPAAAGIPANAPQMSKQTRLEIIRDFETQLVYARSL